jgi:hypothetical protein
MAIRENGIHPRMDLSFSLLQLVPNPREIILLEYADFL